MGNLAVFIKISKQILCLTGSRRQFLPPSFKNQPVRMFRQKQLFSISVFYIFKIPLA